MSRLRKAKFFSYVLPLVTTMFLLSVVGSVLASHYKYDKYIGKIDCQLITNQSGNETVQYEKMILQLYNDPDLNGGNESVAIYSGEDYGYPVGLIATAVSAQQQRTKVDIETSDGVRVMRINQDGNPDDIAGAIEDMVGDNTTTLSGIQDGVDGTYYNVVELRSDLDNANLTDGLDVRFDNQDRALRRIIKDLEGEGNVTSSKAFLTAK